jgi:hypothetical protein
MTPNQHANYGRTFRAIHDAESPWQEGSKSYLKLPEGVQVKIFARDDAMGRIDMKVKFPPVMSSLRTLTRAGILSSFSRGVCALQARICVPATTSSAGTNCTDPTSTPMAAKSSSSSWVKAFRMNGTRRSTRTTGTFGRRKLRKAEKASPSISPSVDAQAVVVSRPFSNRR